MSTQYIARTYDGQTMYEAQYATNKPAKGKKWYTCIICGFDYPEDKVDLSTGTPFCIPGKCYEDIGTTRTGGKV